MMSVHVSELMQEFMDNERMSTFEGSRGIEQLNNICCQIGYPAQQYRYGSSLEEFLSDNPGCCEAIVAWIDKQAEKNEDWKSQLTLDDDDRLEISINFRR
jgi:hypothetical protein